MAAKKETQATKLVLKVITGTATSGKAITASRTYSAVNPAVSDDDMLDIGAALGALQSHDVQTISASIRQRSSMLADPAWDEKKGGDKAWPRR